MNDLLELKGTLEYDGNHSSVQSSIPEGKLITSKHLRKLSSDLDKLVLYWNNQDVLKGALISVYYNRIIPKSRRIQKFMSEHSEESNQYIRGVRFEGTEKKHVITYYISKTKLKKCIDILNSLIDILDNNFSGVMNNDKLSNISGNEKFLSAYNFSKSSFKTNMIDLIDIDKFDVYKNDDNIVKNDSYITFYKTELNISELMTKLGINNTEYNQFADDTIYINNKNVLAKIREKTPYMISMAMIDLATYTCESQNRIDPTVNFSDMPDPTNEPTIGVIDTLFAEDVYFSKWVEYHDCLHKDIEREPKDYVHGTEVSSIIVDGARINSKWDDECGFFKVRHFGVAKEGCNNSFDIITKIKTIVEENRDIHVWNISLGSDLEISENYISPEASILDEIQYNNNVIFVVAGTNNNTGIKGMKIGAPADSINSMVVNAVDKDLKKTSYARKGEVLSFFVKPDLCAFGGDDNEYMNVCCPTGRDLIRGTSFAAPWISRKLSFLIDKMGLSREIAKALLISSAVKWNEKNEDQSYLGYGTVPAKISEVMLGEHDEIKFYIEGQAKSYSTFTYNLPIPLVNGKFPFYSKAVMCYFPKCSRSQGVDYTNTELDLSFGRIGEDGKIKSINKNTQSDEGNVTVTEADARKLFRKWDNVKVVVDQPKTRRVPKQSYGTNFWGIRITNKERIERDRGLKFGVVITLKEMFEKNRLREFVDQCQIRGWIVNKITIDNRLEIQAEAEEIIKFE